jgi:hypothetical protein
LELCTLDLPPTQLTPGHDVTTRKTTPSPRKTRKTRKNNCAVDGEGEALMIIVFDDWVVGNNNRWATGGTDGLIAIGVVSAKSSARRDGDFREIEIEVFLLVYA